MDHNCGGRMAGRIWDAFLTERDAARAALQPATRKGAGTRPALVLVDLYRSVFGDTPQPLLDAIGDWPNSCGLVGWEALPRIRYLLDACREAGLPVLHITGLDD